MSVTSDELIRVSNLHFTFPMEDRPVLKGVDLRVRRGEFVLLMGPSGAGKSTLSLCLNGAIPKSIKGEFRGEIWIDGEAIEDKEIHEVSAKVGMVLQDPDSQFATLNVTDEIAFPLENLRFPPEVIIRRCDEVLKRVGLEHKRDARPDQLSGGEKQRLALASMLVMEPEALILDEPTANLDPVGAAEVFALLRQLKEEGMTILLIEHRIDEIMKVVDRVLILGEQGQIVADGSPLEIFNQMSADELWELGVWMPDVVRLGIEMKKLGVDCGPLTLLANEFAQGLPEETLDILTTRNPQHSAMSRAGQNLIRVDGLSFTYGEGAPALADIRFAMERGEFLAIVGANGSGKTTLALGLTGLLKVESNRVFVDNEDITDLSARDVIRKFAYVFQNPEHQFVTDLVQDEVGYSLQLQNRDEGEVKATVDQLLEEFGLDDRRWANPFSISQGEKRRLSVASMLALRQEAIILDEPTFGQDMQNAYAIMEKIRGLHLQGRSIVMITHDMKLVAEYATKVLVLSSGRQLLYGSVSELFNNEDVLTAARIDRPPIWDVTRELKSRNPHFPSLMSVSQFTGPLEASKTGPA